MQPLSLGRLRFTNALLLSLNWCRPKDPPISLGAASILTLLQKGGVTATALQYNVNDPKFDSDAVVNCVFAQKPDRRTLLGMALSCGMNPTYSAFCRCCDSTVFLDRYFSGVRNFLHHLQPYCALPDSGCFL